MNALRVFSQCRVLAHVTVLCGAMVTAVPHQAYGQQEVDPTWLDPWATPTMAVHSVQKLVPQRHERKVRPRSSSQRTTKLGAKRAITRTKRS